MLKSKKVLSVCLSLLLALNMSTSAIASTHNNITKEEFVEQLEIINSKYSDNLNAELIQPSMINGEQEYNIINPNNIIKLNSLEELEDLMNVINDSLKEEKIIERTIKTPVNPSEILRAETYADSYVFTWKDWAWWVYLLSTYEIFIDKNILLEFNYIFNNGIAEFNQVTYIDSYISGAIFNRAWEQKGNGISNITATNRPRDTISATVHGVYILGIEVAVGGVTFPIGLTTADTWKVSLYYES